MAEASTTQGSNGFLEFLAPRRPDSAAARHLIAGAAFAAVAGLGLAVLGVKLLIPSFLETIPVWSYGRLRPVTINAAMWGFASISLVGVAYYLTPRLTGAPLWAPRLASANLWLSVGAHTVGIVVLAMGMTQGRDLAEYPLWLDAVVIVTIVIPTLIVTKTLGARTERSLHPSMWYTLGGLYWLVGLYLVGNAPGPGGVGDLLQTSFFSSGIGGLWLVGMGVGGAYYLMTKVSGAPLYSRPIALVGFWSLAFAQVWAGPARWIWGPIPDWTQGIGAVFGIALIVPAAAVIANLVGTLRPRWQLMSEEPSLRFAMAGALVYLIITVLAALAGFRPAATVMGLTEWHDGILTATLFGAAALFVAGFAFHALPRILGRQLYRRDLAQRQLSLTITGLIATAGAQLAAGIYQGATWIAGAQTGAWANFGEGFARTVDPLLPFRMVIALGGLLLLSALWAYAYNIFRTITSGDPGVQEILVVGAVADE